MYLMIFGFIDSIILIFGISFEVQTISNKNQAHDQAIKRMKLHQEYRLTVHFGILLNVIK